MSELDGEVFDVSGLLQLWQEIQDGRMDAFFDVHIKVMGPKTMLSFFSQERKTLLGRAVVDSRKFAHDIKESIKAGFAEQYKHRPIKSFFKESKPAKKKETKPCPTCEGRGELLVSAFVGPEQCPACDGSGTV